MFLHRWDVGRAGRQARLRMGFSTEVRIAVQTVVLESASRRSAGEAVPRAQPGQVRHHHAQAARSRAELKGHRTVVLQPPAVVEEAFPAVRADHVTPSTCGLGESTVLAALLRCILEPPLPCHGAGSGGGSGIPFHAVFELRPPSAWQPRYEHRRTPFLVIVLALHLRQARCRSSTARRLFVVRRAILLALAFALLFLFILLLDFLLDVGAI
mmetsp:Transcript_52394/g.114323  ORF Transcript_52394/g.114323 Transcript_52394/m.114323 type:complete len:212 (-) Transcript_52394:700-1335(-)